MTFREKWLALDTEVQGSVIVLGVVAALSLTLGIGLLFASAAVGFLTLALIMILLGMVIVLVEDPKPNRR